MSGQKKVAQRVAWTPDEDRKLVHLVKHHGKNWAVIAEQMEGRVGKQCRERWRNHLDPSINKQEFSEQEDEMILKLVEQIGTKWSQIAEHLDGRTENMVKNRFYCNLRPRGAQGGEPKARRHSGQRPGFASPFKVGDGVGVLDWDMTNKVQDNSHTLEEMMNAWTHTETEQAVEEFVVDMDCEPSVAGDGLTVGVLEGLQKDEAMAIVDAMFALIPATFPSQNVDFTVTSKLEHTIAYIEAAHDYLREHNKASNISYLPAAEAAKYAQQQSMPRIAGKANDGISVDALAPSTIERLTRVDTHIESLKESGAAMAAAIAAAYIFD